MGGPSVKEAKPTEQEIAQFEINKQMWDDYLAHAPEDHQRFMQYETGYVPDGKGNLVVKKGGILNPDGTVVQDTGQAMAAASRNWDFLNKQPINPNRGYNRMGRLDLLNRRQKSDAGIETNTLLELQNRPLRGQEQVIALGRGNQVDALQGMQSLAGQAAQKASADARSSFANSSANRYLLGTGIGAIGGYYAYKNANNQQRRNVGGASGFFNLLGGL